MRLCVLFRVPSVRQLQQQLSPREFWEWVAYLELEDPEWRAELRNGFLISAVLAAGGCKEKMDPTIFMTNCPKFLKPEKTGNKLDPAEWENYFKNLAEKQTCLPLQN